VFWINPFLCVAPLIIFTLFFRDKPRKGGFRSQLKKVDWVGMLLVSVSCVSLLYGLLAGGAIYPWISAPILVTLLLGVIGIVVFVVHQGYLIQKYTAVVPLIPLRLFDHRTSATGYLITFLHSICLAAVLNFFFIYVSHLLCNGGKKHTDISQLNVSSSLTILQASATMLPMTAFLFTSAAAAGVFTSRNKKYRIYVLLGALLLVGGLVGFTQINENTPRVAQIFLQIPLAIGAGMIFPARLLATQATQRDQATMAKAAATMTFIFNLGQCFGLPLGAVIYETEWDRLVRLDEKAGAIPPQLVITSHNAEGSAELIRTLPKAVADEYRHIMADSISKIWIALTVLGGLIFILGMIMKEVSLDTKREATPPMRESNQWNEDTNGLIANRADEPGT
jgi:hypothetical protein